MGLLSTELEMKVQLPFYSFQVEICTSAMFMRLILGLDVYLATILLLTIIGTYTITGEVTVTTPVWVLTQKLYLLVGSWQVLRQETSAFTFYLNL